MSDVDFIVGAYPLMVRTARGDVARWAKAVQECDCGCIEASLSHVKGFIVINVFNTQDVAERTPHSDIKKVIEAYTKVTHVLRYEMGVREDQFVFTSDALPAGPGLRSYRAFLEDMLLGDVW